ncbi:MAG TPA: TIGR02757 family protein [Thermoanaerobaculia bacterium]|nr:TIGR02757 family protein [Thermoanaerobaculia bacterium]
MPQIRPIRNRRLLAERLDTLVETFDLRTLSPDPLELVLRFDDPLDQETAGLIVAAFAYGRARMIVTNIGRVLDAMGESPYVYLRDLFGRREATRRFAGFSHRFHKTPELVAFLSILSTAIREHGTLGDLFRRCDRAGERDIGEALARFVDAMLEGERLTGASVQRAMRYLLTSPRDGSACKRMNLYLRWMVRREPPDLGLWTFVDPARLIVPLDTHVHRISTFLGLNRRKASDWKTARLLTDQLASFDAADPIRYDFAICRLGILDRCSRKRSKANCDICLLRDVCRFPC